MLNPDMTLRQPKEVEKEKNEFSPDWVVILGKRHKSRRLEQSDEIEAAMQSIYSSDRVKTFDGDIGILEGETNAHIFYCNHLVSMACEICLESPITHEYTH